jgi:hypothetical protein
MVAFSKTEVLKKPQVLKNNMESGILQGIKLGNL